MTQQNANHQSCGDEPMTQAALRNLRNAGGLEVGCSYTINNYSRGCLAGLVEGITLTATANNSLSMDADINTTLDTVDWHGVYNIDTNRITHLEDDRGNKVWSRVGNQVDLFPWGKSTWYGVTVDNVAALTVDCDPDVAITNTTFHKESNTNLTGATGYIRNSEYSTGAINDYRNVGSLRVTGHKEGERSRFYANGALVVTKTYSSSGDDSYVTIVGSPNFTQSNSKRDSQSRIYSNGKIVRMYGAALRSQGTLRNLGNGELRLYYSEVESYAELRNEAGAGDWYIYGMTALSRAYIRNYMSERNTSYYETFLSSGRSFYRGTVALRSYFNVVSSLATLTVTGTTSVIYGCNITDYVTQFNPSGGTHYSVNLSAGYRYTTAFNSRYIHGRGRKTVTATAANTSRYDDGGTLGIV